MKNIFYTHFISFLLFASNFCFAIPSFPNAQGFGSETTGGSGRHLNPPKSEIILVNSLEDKGKNSLRECVEKKIPRICIFEVGGNIILKNKIKIRDPYITIAGQTAPKPGILITGAGIEISTHDVIIQHLEVRPGDLLDGPNPETRDAISIEGEIPSYNVIVDHLSLSWGIDEVISTGNKGVHDITISNSIISEALNNSIHPKGPHGMGMLIGDMSNNISILNNLFASNNERNPRIKFGSSVELIDNIIYGWGGKSGWHIVNLTDTENTNKPISLFAAGNIFKPSKSSPIDKPFYAKTLPTNSKILLKNNFMFQDLINQIDNKSSNNFLDESLIKSSNDFTSFKPNNYMEKSGNKIWDEVIKSVGANPKIRNEIDKRIIKDVIEDTGSIKDCLGSCENSVGPLLIRETNFQKHKLPHDPFNDNDKNGYLNIEDWINKF